MKNILMLLVVLLGVNAFADLKSARSVQIGITGAYVPGGFDSAADAFVIVNGVFQNGCYRWDKADIKNVDNFNHEISSFANVSSGMCIMVLIPYQKEVKLGKLASGKHTLKFLPDFDRLQSVNGVHSVLNRFSTLNF